MRFISYLNDTHQEQLAIAENGFAYDTQAIHPELPATMAGFLANWDAYKTIAERAMVRVRQMEKYTQGFIRKQPLRNIDLLSPVPKPASVRDGYAFRQHVAAARRNRGLEMIPQFDEYPVFYFTNHQAVQGEGAVTCMPDHFERLDFELEVAVVICREGRNISAAAADGYIAGLMVMNDFSARTLQMEEMLLNLGPAKGKDFATAFGPELVTPDELKSFEVPCKPGHTGKSWNLAMSATVNGCRVSQGNMADMDWTFAELIERASYGVTLYPGDIIGSGTVGTGCFLELNGSKKNGQWLRPGDTIDLAISQLGTLRNIMVPDNSSHSILQLKKTAAWTPAPTR